MICFSPLADTLVSVKAENRGQAVMVWDATTGQQRFVLDVEYATKIRGLAISWDGKILALLAGPRSASNDAPGEVQLWNLATGVEIGTVNQSTEADDKKLDLVACSGDGRFLAARREVDYPLRGMQLWDTSLTVPKGDFQPFRGDIRHVVFSADGNRMATCREDDTVRVWDTAGAKLLWTYEETPEGSSRSNDGPDIAAFSADGKLIGIPSLDWNHGLVGVWDVGSNELRTSFSLPVDTQSGSSYLTSDGARFLLLINGEIQIINTSDGQIVSRVRQPDEIRSFAVAPDDELVAAHRRGGIDVCRVDDGRTMHSLTWPSDRTENQSDRAMLSFASDAPRLAAAAGFRVAVWDLTSGREIASVDNGEEAIDAVALSPNGLVIAFANAKTVVVHNLARNRRKTLGGK